MITAAQVARIFRMDPITVLDADPFTFEVRMAAARAAVRQMEQEASHGI